MLEPADPRAAVQPGSPSRTASPASRPRTKLMLVDFRSGECVSQHPEIAPLLNEGWQIRSAVPRIVEAQGTKLFVVLSQATRPALTPALMV